MAYVERFNEYELQRRDKKNKAYVDISLAFTPSPVTNDITILTNDRAINNSIKNIIMTLPSEVVFFRDFGSRTNLFLFDMIDETSAVMLEDEIRRAIEFNEPRVSFEYPNDDRDFLIGQSYADRDNALNLDEKFDGQSLGVFVKANIENNEYTVTVKYLIVGYLKRFDLQVLLTPTR